MSLIDGGSSSLAPATPRSNCEIDFQALASLAGSSFSSDLTAAFIDCIEPSSPGPPPGPPGPRPQPRPPSLGFSGGGFGSCLAAANELAPNASAPAPSNRARGRKSDLDGQQTVVGFSVGGRIGRGGCEL